MIAEASEWKTVEMLLVIMGFSIAVTILVLRIMCGWSSNGSKGNSKANLAAKVDVAMCEVIKAGNEKDHQFLNDCIEKEIKLSVQRHAELKDEMIQRHVEHKKDLNLRHAELRGDVRGGFESVATQLDRVFSKLGDMGG